MKHTSILIAAVSAFASTAAYADSSGNFTATGTSATCVATPAAFDANAGGFVGSTLNGGTSTMRFSTQVQTPGGQGTTLLIRPSMTTGLFTSTRLTTTINNATADVGIMVCLYVDPALDKQGNVLKAGLPVNPQNCVVYDQRIQQVSNTLFSNLLSCAPTATACTTTSDCASLGSNYSCVSGFCQQNCGFDILQTTLSAHGFDYVVPVANGTHNVVMTWGLIGQNQSTAGGTTAACVGPVTLTVQQVKNFSNSAPISFTTN
jgi:hypothetical protein